MLSKNSIQPGRYKHYKGGEYQVIDLVCHSETEECLVLYQPLYGESKLWVRPLTLFLEPVLIEGQWLPRFAFVEA